ncbi:HAD superfamily hydrolase (TIGR01509 family) [Pararhizobium capsulatum DSM 1112]|uniref:HAD superfamily hydrolase (TIGR01509 family) n=1 Tax=Pararhizobium capsulatum DSM 1112 TaxID=1121113 RepID=A0ABU0C0R9_9HYPH|nr:HAD family phosphatase [Pararhizobium capsulatum]MDQ0324121.1 HAD superfamily hydrolase (TIGR01509 family) [Pararhizobium capsulatum DSM 1112]
MTEIKSVIFDCDGVLVDSEIIGIKIEVELLHGAGCEISVEQLAERFSGMSWKDILLILEKERGLSLMDLLLDRTEAELDVRIPAEARAIDGVLAVLQELRYPRCVCSNTKLSRVEEVLTNVGLKEFFAPNIYSAKDLGEGRSKPKPDIFLFGAQQMGFDPSQTVVIEDSVHGVHAARAAGMQVIGFTGGSHTYRDHSENLLEGGARSTISDMRDLPAAIGAITSLHRG